MPQSGDEEEAELTGTQGLFCLPSALISRPVDVAEHHGSSVFCIPPFFGPLLFDNTDSDARDHCANERTFLSYLRLSIYMAIVSIAIIISFHLKNEPTRLELRMAKPLGIIFWLLSLSCLALGFGNYMKTSAGGNRADRLEDAVDTFHNRDVYCGRLRVVPGDELETSLKWKT
ncbi:hypothetical protein D0Z07_0485 [Hyphodiscus hymeniophilus]|uniref:DUF202 domain-containing protein n=1 Tax=Hyphodiscus hymeniophilus TaxID=353542 RepID=A0A9P7B0Y8_9HELO|nr:hypothetical protein D0Z07_0485 [Hyphodiscus hymeniophilus]